MCGNCKLIDGSCMYRIINKEILVFKHFPFLFLNQVLKGILKCTNALKFNVNLQRFFRKFSSKDKKYLLHMQQRGVDFMLLEMFIRGTARTKHCEPYITEPYLKYRKPNLLASLLFTLRIRKV